MLYSTTYWKIPILWCFFTYFAACLLLFGTTNIIYTGMVFPLVDMKSKHVIKKPESCLSPNLGWWTLFAWEVEYCILMKQAEQAKLREKRALNWRRQGARADKSISVMKIIKIMMAMKHLRVPLTSLFCPFCEMESNQDTLKMQKRKSHIYSFK